MVFCSTSDNERIIRQLLPVLLKVRRLSISILCSMSCSMSCSVSVMRLMCLLVAMLMVSSVSGRGVDNLREETEADSSRNDVINIARRQDTHTVLCGRRPAVTSKRHVGDEPFDNGDNSDQLDKLLGADFVTHGELPWQANVYSNHSRKCAGVIINDFWVMTTAHCVYPNYTGVVTVVVGDRDVRYPDFGEQIFGTDHVYLRGEYEDGAGNLDYNLALIKLANSSYGRGIQFYDYVQPICLPEVGESPAIGTQLTIAGWGQTELFSNGYQFNLKKVELPVFNHTACRDHIYAEGRITDRMLCAGNANGSAAACVGDEGNPATYKSGDIHILAGIVSSVSECVAPTNPVVLTSIPAHHQWIHHTISNYSSNNQGVLPRRTQ